MDPLPVVALFHQLPLPDRLNLAVRAPAPWLCTGEDRLRVTARSAVAGITVTLSGRFLGFDGVISPLSYNVAPAADLSASTQEFSLGDGWILNLTARVTAGTPQAGEVFIVVEIIRGAGATAIVLGTLIASYVSDLAGVAWPGSVIGSPDGGGGTLVRLAGADPAAGAEWSIAIPAGTRARLRSVTAVLVTDATVANRELSIVLTANGGIVASIPAGVAHVASQTRRYSAFHASARGAGAASLDVILPLADVVLRAGDTITSVTTAIVAGDNWGAPAAYLEQVADA